MSVLRARPPREGAGLRRKAGRGLVVAWVLVALVSGRASAAPTLGVVKTADGIPSFEEAIEGLEKASSGEVAAESLRVDPERWPKVRERLAKKTPDVWVPVGPLALKVTYEASLGAPIVFLMVATPENSIPRGASNVAGVTVRLGADVQVRHVKRLLPAATKLGVIHDASNATAVEEVRQARQAAASLGMTIETAEIRSTSELGSALQDLVARDVDVLWLVPDTTVTPVRNREAFKFIAETTAKAGVPVVGYAAKHAQAGALFALAADYADIGAQAAEIAEQVASGVAPADIGWINARKVNLSVNEKVAELLGISLPAEVTGDPSVQVFD